METTNFFNWYLANRDKNLICENHIDYTFLHNSGDTEIITICFRYDYWDKVNNLIQQYYKEIKPTITDLNQLNEHINLRDCIFFRFVGAFEKHYGEKDFTKIAKSDMPYLYLHIIEHDFTTQWNAQILFCNTPWYEKSISDSTLYEDMYQNFRGEFFQYLETKLNNYKNIVLNSLICDEEENQNSLEPSPTYNNDEKYKDLSKEDYIFCKKIQADNVSGYIFQVTDY